MATWLRDDSDLTVQTGINSTQIGTNLTISGNEIDVSSGDLLIDVAGEINLDTVDGKVKLKKNGSSAVYASLESNLGELRIKSGASYATCLTLAGNDLKVQGNLTVGSIAAGDGSSENFVVEQSGLLLKRTAAEVRSDLGISDAEIIDWTADQGSTNIHADNYGNINASVVVASGLTTSAGLKLSNNIIYASDGDAAITLDTDSNVIVAGTLEIDGNAKKASDGGTAITMDTSDNVGIGNDLIVGGELEIEGNVIRAADAGTCITMDNDSNVAIAGD